MKKLLLLSVFVLFVSRLYADDYYWVGGTGSWSDLTHWASVSGGSANKSIVPGINDDVHFDANSGLVTNAAVSMPTTGHAYCRNMSWAGVTASAIFRNDGAYNLNVYGSVELSAAVRYGFQRLSFEGSSNATYKMNGASRFASFINAFIVNKPGGSLTLLDGIPAALVVNISLAAGNLDMSGNTHSFNTFDGFNSGGFTAVRSANISNATLVLTATWDYRGANGSLTTTGSYIKTMYFRSDRYTFPKVDIDGVTTLLQIANTTFGELTFTDPAAPTGALRIGGNNTINRLEFKGGGRIAAGGNVINQLILGPGKGYIFHGSNTVNERMQLNTPDCDALGELTGADLSAKLTFGASAVTDIRNVYIKSLAAAGGITPITVIGADGGDNTGWDIQPRPSGTNLYWVGGAGNWDDKAHWSTVSGGAGGACVPFVADNVTFDANSGFSAGNNTVSLTGNAWCHNMSWTNVAASPVLNTASAQLEVWGSVVLHSTMTLNGNILIAGTEAATIATNGCSNGTLRMTVYKANTSGGLTFTDNINFPGLSLVLSRGQLSLANRVVNMELFNSTTGVGRIIDITNATITVNYWNLGLTNVTWVGNAAGSFITSNQGFTANGLTYPKVYCTTNLNQVSITSTTIGELVFTNTAPSAGLIGLQGGNTIGTLEFKSGGELRGNNTITNLLLAPSRAYTIRNQQTINGLFRFNSPDCNGLGQLRGVTASLNFGPSSTLDFNNVYLQDMSATGKGVPINVTGADAGGNTGFNITPSAGGPRYWVGGSGDWNEPAHWSATSGGAGGACVPTVANDVYFDASSFSSGSNAVSFVQAVQCRNMNWTGAGFNPVFTQTGAARLEIWGNLTLSPTVTMNAVVNFVGAMNSQLTSNGNKLGNLDMVVAKPAGYSLRFMDNFSNTQTRIELRYGGLDLSSRTVDLESLSDVNVPDPTSLNITNATVTALWEYQGNAKSLQAAGSTVISRTWFTVDGGTYNKVYVTATLANQIAISTTTIGELVFTNASGSSGARIMAGNTIGRLEFKGKGYIGGTGNTIDTLIFAPGKVYTFADGTNTTITKEWFGSGTPCNLTEITSASSTATITKTTGDVEFDYVRLRGITAAGMTPFNALEHSENLGNNTNWNIAPYNGSTPVYGLGPDITLCANEFPHTLTTDGFFASPLASFLWNDGSTQPTLVISNPGTYSVTVSYPDGCSRTDQIIVTRSVVTVEPITGDADICMGEATTLTSATPGGVWSTSDAAIATVSATGLVTSVATGAATITYTVTNANGCIGVQQRAVAVNALPVVSNTTGTLTLFEGGNTTLSNSTAGGVWSSSNTAVATVNSSGVVTGVSGGQADITYTVTNAKGCTASSTVTVTVDGFSPAKRVLAITKTADAQEPSTNGGFSVHLPTGVLAVEAINITYTVSGTAAAPGDYAALSGTAVIAAGQNSVAIPVNVNNDQLIENDETVIATLSAGTSANYTYTINAAAGNAAVVIKDDDNVPANRVLSVTSQLTASEPAGTGTFTVALPAGVLAPENINITYTLAGTSINGTDYETLPGTVVIPAGQNSVVISVKAIDDKIIEKTETIELTLTAATTATAGSFTISSSQGAATLNQNDDDYTAATRLLSVAGNGDAAEPSTNSSFTISLPAGYTCYLPITITAALTGTAANGVDYNGPAATITLPAGQNSVNVPVNVVDDGIIEATESVILKITGGVANEAGSAVFSLSPNSAAATATVNINDDESTAANTVLSVSAQNAAEPSTPGAFTISLPAGLLAAENITVHYTVSGTAAAGADYTALPASAVIAAGQNNVKVTLNVTDDQTIESTETVILTLTGGSSASISYTVSATNGSATADIADNDYATGSLVVLLTKVSDAIEGGTNGQYRISFPPGVISSEDVTVTFAMTGTSASGSDYSILGLSAGNIVIPAGANEVYIDLDAANDGIIEGPETAVLTLNAASSPSHSYTIDPSSNGATVNIVDANAASSTPLQVITGTNGAEPGVNPSFTVKLAGVATSAWPVTVGYRISGTATPGTDYQSIGMLTIPANTNAVPVTLPVLDDKIIEATENIQFTLLSGSATDGGGNAFIFPPDPANDDITMQLLDDDATALNQVLKVTPATDGAEPGTNGSYTVSLPPNYSAAASITLNYTMSGTATRNTDYSVSTITLPAYNNSVSIPLGVTDDQIIETTETAILTLNGGTDGNSFTYSRDGASYEATVNIADDDGTSANRMLSIASTADAAEPGTNGAVTISLPAGVTAADPITVNYTIAGTAAGGQDYDALTGTAIIPAGDNNVTVPVTVKDDQVIEQPETVNLTITGGVGGALSYSSAAGAETAVVNIADNDNTPANTLLTITPGTNVTEGSATPVEFTISLPAGVSSSEDITVSYTVNGMAQPGLDYTALSGTLVIPAGQTSVTLSTPVLDDQLLEADETVHTALNGGSSASFTFSGTADATVSILDDERKPENLVLDITKITDAAEPGTNGGFRISLPTGIIPSEDVTVNYTISGSAVAGADYNALPGTVVIPAGQTSVDVQVTVINDQVIEPAETVIATLNGGSSSSFTFTGTSSATVSITDDENSTPANRVLTISKNADGAEPNTAASFTISLPAGIFTAEDVTVSYTTGGTATSGSDYAALSGSAVIPAGGNSVIVPVTVSDDQLIETTETVSATLSGGSSASFSFTASGTATVDIADDESALPANLVLNITKGADAAEPDTDGSFTISLPAGILSSEDVTVNYTVNGTAAAGDDYAALSGAVIIPAGQNSVSVPVTTADDNIIEAAETVAATLTGGSSASFTFTGAGTATVVIADNDNIPANLVLGITKLNDAAEPASVGLINIALPAGVTAAEDITATYTVAGTATADADYAALSGTAIIPAGQHSVTVPVSVIDDQVIEQQETVVLTLTGGSSASFTFTGTAAETMNIADDDNTPANMVLNVSAGTAAAEPDVPGSFIISLPAGVTATEDINVTYAISGTATAGDDYNNLAGLAVIPAGANSVTIPVSVVDDQLIEGTETVTMEITGGSGASLTLVPGTDKTASLDITDDDLDPAKLVLNILTKADGAEPGADGSFTIGLPTGVTASMDITVSYTISGTAIAGVDYTALTGTVIIPAGQSSITVPLIISDDDLVEPAETAILTLTGGKSAGITYTIGANSSATVNIADDDNSNLNLLITASKPDAAEPNTDGEFTISLASGKSAADPITIGYVISGTATAGADYTAITGTITIPAGQSVVTVPVQVMDDAEIETPETVTFTITGGQSSAYTYTAGASAAATVNISSDDSHNADLLITKEIVQPATGPYRLGQDITYRIRITNIGQGMSNGVVVTDTLPLQLGMPVRTVQDGGQVEIFTANSVLIWTIGNMAPGATLQLEVSCRLIDGGRLIATAAATSGTVDLDETNNKAAIDVMVEGTDLAFPNTFTPNGDGKNEKFIIGGIEKYTGSSLYIFNRWGGQVYQSKDYRNDWNGSGLNEGTYFYILEVKKPDGIKKYKGWVTIVR